MNAVRTAGVPRRTWRAAVAVFLVVFLGGLGVSGASALWSQQGSVQSTVTTGSWCSTPQENWELPMRIYDFDAGWDRNAWILALWEPRNGGSFDPCVTFKATLQSKKQDGKVISREAVDVGTKSQALFWVNTGRDNKAYFVLTVTPYMNGVAGLSVQQTIEVTVKSRPSPRLTTGEPTEPPAKQVEVRVIEP